MSIATPALYVMIRTAISMQMEKLKGQPPQFLFLTAILSTPSSPSVCTKTESCLLLERGQHPASFTLIQTQAQTRVYNLRSTGSSLIRTHVSQYFFFYHVSKNSARQLNVLRCILDIWMWMRDTGFISSPNRKNWGRLTLNVCTFLRSPLFQRPILGNKGPYPCPHS